jgi:hypothetical protein
MLSKPQKKLANTFPSAESPPLTTTSVAQTECRDSSSSSTESKEAAYHSDFPHILSGGWGAADVRRKRELKTVGRGECALSPSLAVVMRDGSAEGERRSLAMTLLERHLMEEETKRRRERGLSAADPVKEANDATQRRGGHPEPHCRQPIVRFIVRGMQKRSASTLGLMWSGKKE